MIRILALTAMDNSADLNDAAAQHCCSSTETCSALKNSISVILNPSAQALILYEAALSRADIVLIDVRSDTRLGRCLPELLAGHNKTVVVLIAVSNDIFALTRMGAFSGRMIFKPGRERPFSINDFIKAKKFAALGKKLTSLLPVRMLRDMNRWMLLQQYYAQGGADNLYAHAAHAVKTLRRA